MIDLRNSPYDPNAAFNLFKFTADNFTALSLIVGETGDFAYVFNSQGTQWLPGTLGGTYFPSGFYIYDGAVWVMDDTMEQVAEQLDLIGLGVETQFSQDLTISTITSSSYQDKLTHGTGTATGTFIVIFFAMLTNDGDLGSVRLRNITDNDTLTGEIVFKPTDAAEQKDCFGMAPIFLAGVNKDLVIQWKDNSGGNNQTLSDAKIFLLKTA